MDIKQQEVADWRQHATTQKIFKYLIDKREDLKEAFASGFTAYKSTDETVLKTAELIGQCNLLQEIIDISFSDISNFYEPEIEENYEK